MSILLNMIKYILFKKKEYQLMLINKQVMLSLILNYFIVASFFFTEKTFLLLKTTYKFMDI